MGKQLLKNSFRTLISYQNDIFLMLVICISIWLWILSFHIAALIIIIATLFYIINRNLKFHTYFLCFITTLLIISVILFLPSIQNISTNTEAFSFSDLKRVSDVKKGDSYQSFIGEVNNQRFMIFVPNQFQIGLSCSGSGEVKDVDTTRNPSLAYFFASQRINKQITVKTLHCETPHIFHFQYFRDLIHKQFSIYQETGELYFTLLFGGGAGTELIQTSTWQTLGLIHLISLSGLQINIILVYIAKLYRLFPLGETKRKIINNIFLAIYCIICWNALPFIRIISIKLFEEWGNNKNKLLLQSMTACLFLLFWPECYYNIGFWFSLIMQCSLIYIDIFNAKYQLQKGRKFIVTSCILFLQTLIISKVYILSISPMFLLTNAVYIPLFEYVLLPIMLLGILFLPMQPVVIHVLSVTQLFFEQCIYYVQNCYVYTYEALLAFIANIINMFFITYHKNIKYILCNIILSTTLVISSLIFIPRTNITTFLFMDVGQGDSSIIYLADTQSLIVIDTGPPSTHYLKHLKQQLYRIGKTHIDYLIITHEDSDHAGNVKEILNDYEIQPQQLLLPNTNKTDALLNIASANKKETTYIDKESTIFKTNKLPITILNPGYHLKNENENSIVLQFQIGENKILYQADAGENFEQANQFPLSPLSILKVSHHGSHSGSSESFIQSIQPKYSIISAGKHNLYGHPHQEVISRLKKANSTILQTKESGDIQFQCTANKCYQTL